MAINKKITDTQIHRGELLVTLDYLAKYTDKQHPATHQKIIDHAANLGVSFKPNRQRISDCLQYLMAISMRFPDFPFIVETTKGGKYYIESRYLQHNQVIMIIKALKNDRYLDQEDTEYLIDVLLNFLVSDTERQKILDKVKQVDVVVQKNDRKSLDNYERFEEAWRTRQQICILRKKFIISKDDDHPHYTLKEGKVWCRVYKIQEFHNTRYVILVPISEPGIFVEPIDAVEIPRYSSKREIMMEDEDDASRINYLFANNNPGLALMYDNIDDYLAQNIYGGRGIYNCVSFYFNYQYLEDIKKSFASYFAQELKVIEANDFTISPVAYDKPYYFYAGRSAQYGIEEITRERYTAPKYGVVNINIRRDEFINWIISNPNIAEKINIVSPISITMNLAQYYTKKVNNYMRLVTRIMGKTNARNTYEWGKEMFRRLAQATDDIHNRIDKIDVESKMKQFAEQEAKNENNRRDYVARREMRKEVK